MKFDKTASQVELDVNWANRCIEIWMDSGGSGKMPHVPYININGKYMYLAYFTRLMGRLSLHCYPGFLHGNNPPLRIIYKTDTMFNMEEKSSEILFNASEDPIEIIEDKSHLHSLRETIRSNNIYYEDMCKRFKVGSLYDITEEMFDNLHKGVI